MDICFLCQRSLSDVCGSCFWSLSNISECKKVVSVCQHQFHSHCINTSLRDNGVNCPICQSRVVPIVQNFLTRSNFFQNN